MNIEPNDIVMNGVITLPEIEKAVAQLSKEDLEVFRNWFTEFDAQQWDNQLENDIMAGKLDALADKALEHLRARRCTEL